MEITRTRRTWFWSLLTIVLFCIAGMVFTQWAVFLVIGFLSFLALFLGLSKPPEPRLSMEEYKTLPGAVDARRGHACLHCGHHGIYRRTVYKTSTTLADCSACQAPLWTS